VWPWRGILGSGGLDHDRSNKSTSSSSQIKIHHPHVKSPEVVADGEETSPEEREDAQNANAEDECCLVAARQRLMTELPRANLEEQLTGLRPFLSDLMSDPVKFRMPEPHPDFASELTLPPVSDSVTKTRFLRGGRLAR
jgi:hypothetical protein